LRFRPLHSLIKPDLSPVRTHFVTSGGLFFGPGAFSTDQA